MICPKALGPRRQSRNHCGIVTFLLCVGLATPLWAPVLSKGTVSHPGGNFCTTRTVASFVSSGGDLVVIFQDQLPYNGPLVGLSPFVPGADQFSYNDLGGMITWVTIYRGLTPGQQYTCGYSICGPTPNFYDFYTIIEDGCPANEDQVSGNCRWEDVATALPLIDFGETILVGQSVQRSVRLVNTSGQVLSTTVGIGCSEFSIVGNPAVSIPGGGSTTLTLRYAPAIENTAVGELAPSCLGTMALGSAIGPRLYVGTSTSVLRRRLDGSADVTLSSSANRKDFAADVANRDVYMAAQSTADDTNDGIYKGNLDGYFTRIINVANPWSVDYDPVGNKVYWGAGGAIRRANPDGTAVENLPTPISFEVASPVDIAIDAQARLLYWTEGTSTLTIRRATLDGQEEVTLATIPSGGNPRLALDRAAGRLYWSENTTGRIRRIHVDGTNQQTLLTPESNTPVDIAVDPAQAHIYWSDAGTGSLHRMSLDGEDHAEIFTGYSGATGLMLLQLPVPGTDRIFWLDSGTDVMQSVLKDGSQVQTTVSTGLSEPRGMAIDADDGKVYWVDQGTDRIRRANLNGSAAVDLVSTGLVMPQDIALDLGAGKMYWTDSAFEGAVQIKRANLDGSGVQNVHGSGNWGVRGIALDTVHGKMYWSEIEAGEPAIYRANLNGTGTEIFLVEELVYPPLDFEIDVDGGKIYWTEALAAWPDAGLVRRANLDRSDVETLYNTSTVNGGLIRFIALDLGARKVYWTQANELRRLNMDGSGGGTGTGTAEEVGNLVLGSSHQGIAVAARTGYPTPTDVDPLVTLAPRVHLDVPRPNPFNPSTLIAYTHAGGALEVVIYDVRGRLVRTLFTGPRAAGSGTMAWDGMSEGGDILPSGLYFVKLRSQEHVRTEKAVLVR